MGVHAQQPYVNNLLTNNPQLFNADPVFTGNVTLTGNDPDYSSASVLTTQNIQDIKSNSPVLPNLPTIRVRRNNFQSVVNTQNWINNYCVFDELEYELGVTGLKLEAGGGGLYNASSVNRLLWVQWRVQYSNLSSNMTIYASLRNSSGAQYSACGWGTQGGQDRGMSGNSFVLLTPGSWVRVFVGVENIGNISILGNQSNTYSDSGLQTFMSATLLNGPTATNNGVNVWADDGSLKVVNAGTNGSLTVGNG